MSPLLPTIIFMLIVKNIDIIFIRRYFEILINSLN